MKDYLCSWQIDVSAETPREAAEQAERLMSGRVQSSWRVTDHRITSVSVEVRPVHEAPAQIGARIREFRRLCNADEHTDTGDAWDLFDWIEEHATDVPPTPRYRWLLTIFSSRFDKYGNRYHFARLVSTIAGKSLQFGTASASNARAAVSKAAQGGRGALSEVCYTAEIQDVPIRVHNAGLAGCTCREDGITPELLQELEN